MSCLTIGDYSHADDLASSTEEIADVFFGALYGSRAKHEWSDLRVHFKNAHETATVLRNMPLRRAQRLLENVKEHREIVSFLRLNGVVGRKAQANQLNTTHGRRPKKSAPTRRAQECREQGYVQRFGPHCSTTCCQVAPTNLSCRTEVILTEKEDAITKPTDDISMTKKESKRKQRRQLARGEY
ncbi:unnamed protein product [Heligmosomoides polygyrus]|uniref:Uncharacterized protein n=1 Tax=Heligmosomoides polygyrus TaxID=6339 RepID=A0A3P8B6F5_HELPZ|nr:unnamed protein product [Heligmosomoides polygyrus]